MTNLLLLSLDFCSFCRDPASCLDCPFKKLCHFLALVGTMTSSRRSFPITTEDKQNCYALAVNTYSVSICRYKAQHSSIATCFDLPVPLFCVRWCKAALSL